MKCFKFCLFTTSLLICSLSHANFYQVNAVGDPIAAQQIIRQVQSSATNSKEWNKLSDDATYIALVDEQPSTNAFIVQSEKTPSHPAPKSYADIISKPLSQIK